MSRSIHIRFETDGTVSSGDIREAYAGLSEDDVSKSSPITGSSGEIATTTGDGWVGVAVGSAPDGWTKTSQEALVDAVLSIPGVKDVLDIDGGYTPE